jgi:signal peptide peptidase SppA
MIIAKYFPNKPMLIEPSAVIITCKKQVKLIDFQGIATIPVHGILTKTSTYFEDFFETTSYEEIYQNIAAAVDNPRVSKIILDIDSPGGEVSGLFDLCDFIAEACKIKPIIAHANDSCLSAAYAIAANCSQILVNRTSAVGSIGVIATHLDVSGADKKDGLKYTTIFKGARKNDLNPHEPMNTGALESLNKELDRLYEMFVALVAKGRNITVEAVKATEAGIFYGEDAIKTNLADQITTQFKREKIMEDEEKITEEQISLAANSESLESYRSEIAEIARLCKLARMPGKLAEFIEAGASVDDVREALMKALANKTEDIRSAISVHEKPAESPVVAAATARKFYFNGERK